LSGSLQKLFVTLTNSQVITTKLVSHTNRNNVSFENL
jgi:hypothetical protein